MTMESRNDTAQALAAARQALDRAEAAREAVLPAAHRKRRADRQPHRLDRRDGADRAGGGHPARHHPAGQHRHRAGLRHRPQRPHRGQHRGRRHHRQTPARSTHPRSAPTTTSGPSPMCGRAPPPTTASIWGPTWRPRTPALPGATPSAT